VIHASFLKIPSEDMMKTGHLRIGMLLLCLSVALIVSGCGGAPEPTATAVPPTFVPTAVPPTQLPPTQVPPTQPPASTGTQGGPLLDALNQVKAATTYRVDLVIQGQGNFAAGAGPTPEAGATDKPMTLVMMKGEVNGKDAHFTLQGVLTSFLGIDPEKTFEVITSDGKAYVKGPVPLLGATEEKWYEAPPNAASVAQPPLTPGSFLESFGESGINPADFKQLGTESLDGKSCQVLAGDKTAVINAFSKLGGATGATQEDLDSIDNAEFKFWVCDDGYLHQVKMLVEGHDKTKPDQKGSFEILMKITDFNADIKITPPADAIPLKLPGQETPAVTPTP
jgi:hypothetical protein